MGFGIDKFQYVEQIKTAVSRSEAAVWYADQNTSQPYGRMTHPVGKSYASIVDDEKTSFLGRIKTKNPATFIIAGFPAMDGQRRLWIDTKFLISVCWQYIIQLGSQFDK
jgi:hypothetical protein